MTKKTRYLLISVGFAVFVILSPLTILYVRGISFDFNTKTFVATGILAIRSEPPNADVFLNGKLARRGAGDVKFLTPGEYQIDLKKDGYNTWSKRLAVAPGQVTWANLASKHINLFFSKPLEESLASGVLDFYSNNGQAVYLANEKIIIAPLNNSKKQQAYALPKAANKIIIADDSGKNFVLTQNPTIISSPSILVFNSSNGQIRDISGLFNSLPKMQFDSSGQLYGLSQGVLYKIDVQNKTKTPLLNKITAFDFLADSLYFIKDQSLFVSQFPFKDSQVLLDNLPVLSDADLFVTFEKQIFILSGNSLYLASSGMQKLADNVEIWDFDRQNSALAVVHAGELDYYDSVTNNLNFITRSGEPITQAAVSGSLAGAFFIKNNQLLEIELDSRDNQNQYLLYQGENLQKFWADGAGKNVLVLDNGTLKSLVIR